MTSQNPIATIVLGMHRSGTSLLARCLGLLGVALGPEEHPVHNTALPFTDHQSYSSNIPQVIDPVARLLLDLEPSTSTDSTGADCADGNIDVIRTEF